MMRTKEMKRMNSRTNVLMIAPQPFYEDRGTPIVILEELKVLSRLGYQVDVATYPIGIDIDLSGINIIRAANPLKFRSVAVSFSVRKVVLDLLLFFTVLHLLYRKRYDCIHGVEEGAAIALICKAIYRTPIIYDMHSSLPDQLTKVKFFRIILGQKIAKYFEKFLFAGVDAVIASAGLASYVITKAPNRAVWECYFPPAKSTTNKESLARKLQINRRQTIVYAGNFSAYQGLDVLIEAAAILKAEIPNIAIILVGGSEFDIRPLAHLVEKNKLNGTVQLYARVSRSKVSDYLAIADVLVLPRQYGMNAPLKLFEYMTSNKPIVATNIPAHTVLLDEHSAVLVKPEAEALAQGLGRVIQDKELAYKLAMRAGRAAHAFKKQSLGQTLNNSYRFAMKKSTY
jgi:glycosyltransferase involved in cell wall biosynthesis